MLSADQAPANLAAIVYLWLLEKGSAFAVFSPVLWNKGNAHFSIVAGCNWILYCACEVALVLHSGLPFAASPTPPVINSHT